MVWDMVMKHIGKQVRRERRGKDCIPKEVRVKLLAGGKISNLVMLIDTGLISRVKNLADRHPILFPSILLDPHDF